MGDLYDKVGWADRGAVEDQSCGGEPVKHSTPVDEEKYCVRSIV